MEILVLTHDSGNALVEPPVATGRRSRTKSKTDVARSRTTTLRPRTRSAVDLSSGESSTPAGSLRALNDQAINQHALTLLPKWALRPDPTQLHLLTLVVEAGFANKATAAILQQMRGDWEPSAIMDYFRSVDSFEDLFLAQNRPLEAAHIILAAVNILAEPHRYLPSFPIPARETIHDTACSPPFSD